VFLVVFGGLAAGLLTCVVFGVVLTGHCMVFGSVFFL
jgi:hypothetical protein